ncbi:hypothetical protein [Streptomyces sp. NPDC006610]|uniref:hypothetical protein n=1 Tax=Streptomyces sp. NPDC006610 TaxID=3154584 RepID=UPI0033A7585C
MADVHIKFSDGIREVNVEINGSDEDPLARAEQAAVRLYGIATASASPGHRFGFHGWSLSSDTERSPEE